MTDIMYNNQLSSNFLTPDFLNTELSTGVSNFVFFILKFQLNLKKLYNDKAVLFSNSFKKNEIFTPYLEILHTIKIFGSNNRILNFRQQ